jgi:Transposase
MWYVGLDWADIHHDVVVLDEAGCRVGSRRFAHSHEGLNELEAFLLGIAHEMRNQVVRRISGRK